MRKNIKERNLISKWVETYMFPYTGKYQSCTLAEYDNDIEEIGIHSYADFNRSENNFDLLEKNMESFEFRGELGNHRMIVSRAHNSNIYNVRIYCDDLTDLVNRLANGDEFEIIKSRH